jgi:hypothetical protein
MKIKSRNLYLFILYFAVVFFSILLANSIKVKSHEAPPTEETPQGWQYPIECCHDRDCAPVISSTFVAEKNDLPSLVITTKHGTVKVPKDFSIRPSGDNKMHACIRTFGDDNQSKILMLVCLFMPPSS